MKKMYRPKLHNRETLKNKIYSKKKITMKKKYCPSRKSQNKMKKMKSITVLLY